MTYHLILSAISAVSAMAVVTSESIDAWGKLGSVGILGALCIGFGYLHFRTIRELSTSHRDAVNNITTELHRQHESTHALLSTLVNRELED
jgi:hypothetical protein